MPELTQRMFDTRNTMSAFDPRHGKDDGCTGFYLRLLATIWHYERLDRR